MSFLPARITWDAEQAAASKKPSPSLAMMHAVYKAGHEGYT